MHAKGDLKKGAITYTWTLRYAKRLLFGLK
jgi:hypothetical protein